MDSEQNIKMGTRIKEVRKALKQTQTDFAQSLLMSNNFLSMIENGKANPGLDFLNNAASIYRISMDYLFYGIGEMFINNAGIPPTMVVAEKDFIDGIESVSQLVWLMNHSSIFFHAVISMADKYFHENKKTLKDSLINKKNKEEMSDEL